jgi:hypothetical protein
VHTQQAEIVGRLANDVGDELDHTEELRDVQADAEIQPAVAAAPAVGTKQVPAPAIRRLRKSRVAPGSKGKAAFTLRLDPERHLKLRLACAVTSRSAQLLVTDALDQLLAEMPELDAMAQRAKRKD